MSEATEKHWAGPQGDAYNERNLGLVPRSIAFLAKALARVRSPLVSALEFGCGTGQNLEALKRLGLTDLAGIEINDEAAIQAAHRGAHIYRSAVRGWVRPKDRTWDLVLSKGFLIHVPPLELPDVYRQMYEAASHFILIAEYYNPVPVEVEYRGELGRLWKRDFATEILGQHPNLRVVDYGFCWHHDYPWQQDDITFFLMEKRW